MQEHVLEPSLKSMALLIAGSLGWEEAVDESCQARAARRKLPPEVTSGDFSTCSIVFPAFEISV